MYVCMSLVERVLQDGLYYEYTRYSPTVEIRMYGDDSDKWAFAKFKTYVGSLSDVIMYSL